MLAEFLQFLFSGVTQGAIYALVGIGFSIIYNSSKVINFAQGEFVMIGGMTTVFLIAAGAPLPIAAILAIVLTALVGLALEKLAIEPSKNASVVSLIIITIGASITLRGVAQLIWDKDFHTVPPFSGDTPVDILGATILPQSLWVLGISVIIVIALQFFFNRTVLGKAIIATADNRNAAQLVGINIRFILFLSFGLAAALGALAGIIIAPITLTYYEVGIMLGLKGFSAAILGGLGNSMGAVAGGLIVGIAEAMSAGYISSDYKDAIAFVLILLVLFVRPSGLFGKPDTDQI